MKREMKIAVATIAIGLATVLFASSNEVADKDLGLAKVSVDADSGLVTKPFSYQGKDPGPGDKNKRIPRAYDNAPPMIPHDISSFGEITKDSNACIGCHLPEAAKAVGAISVPKTHLTNLRKNEDLKGELYQGRYNCTQCHAPQAVLDPAVMNKFKGAFRAKTGGEYKTNLIDTIRDGVNEDKSGSFDLSKDLQEK
jgi:cytochrome c-type protein NapB